MTITLTVAGRIATVEADGHVVAGNTYPVTLALDSEWTGSLFMRVRFGSQYYDIPFASSDTSVNVQFPVGYPEVGIGVFSEALEICTNEARVRLLRSILEAGEQVVEFDSDLYDQWAGEVTTLLTDDAFDAESTRPVQNAVLTAWKDIVPLDANLVHKTGDETIGGLKTFTSNMLMKKGSTPYFEIENTNPSSAYGGFREKSSYLVTGGETKVVGEFITTRDSGTNNRSRIMIRTTAPNGSTMSSVTAYSFDDGTAYAEAPSYHADNVADNKIMTRAMLAQTPTVVHTSGIETVAGDKTFTGYTSFRGSTPSVKLVTSTQGTASGIYADLTVRDQYGGSDSDLSIFSWGKSSGGYNFNRQSLKSPDKSTTFLFEQRAYSDHHVFIVSSYYPVDSGGNPQPLIESALVTSGNVAVDPRIVHTTGAETIAGNKTFSGTTNFDACLNIKNATIANDSHWFRLYEISPHTNSGNIEFIVRKRTGASLPARFQLYCGGAGSETLAFQVETNPLQVQCVAARRASDNHVEIWGKTSWTDWQIPFYYRHGMAVSDYQTADEPPAVGDTYNLVATL